MYISGMHGGHGGGKTSSFDRCIFLQNASEIDISKVLVSAVESRPSPLCYLHLLNDGGALNRVVEDATAFGCRNWEFVRVATGVWEQEHDGTHIAQYAIDWVYRVAKQLLPLPIGA